MSPRLNVLKSLNKIDKMLDRNSHLIILFNSYERQSYSILYILFISLILIWVNNDYTMHNDLGLSLRSNDVL